MEKGQISQFVPKSQRLYLLIETLRARDRIIHEYDAHDCHLSPADGCETCESYNNFMNSMQGMCFNRNGLCEDDYCRCHESKFDESEDIKFLSYEK